MPRVTTQRQKIEVPRPAGSLMERIRPVSTVDSGGLKVSLYGRAKTGKTRLISTFPKPVLILGGEDGTRSIRTVQDVYFTRILPDGVPPAVDENGQVESYVYLSELRFFIEELKSWQGTVAMDTASALQDLILADILGLQELPVQKSWGMATREQYGTCGLKTKTLLNSLLQLKCDVAITAHERNFNEEGADNEMLTPTIGSSLQPTVSRWLNGAVEYICQTFIREQTEVQYQTIGTGPAAKQIPINKKTGSIDYCLRVGPHPVYTTGFRLPPGQLLPEAITEPTYDKILALVNGQPIGDAPPAG